MNKKLLIGTLLICLLFTCKKDEKKKSFVPTKVIILVIDGPRYSETGGDFSQQYTPNQKELAKKGVIYSNFFNNGVSYTTPGHTAISTGVYQSIANNGSEIPKNPSIFQYFNELQQWNEDASWIIASKDKLEVLADCYDDPYNGNYNPKTNCGIGGNGTGYRDDAETMKVVFDVLRKKKPQLTLINLKEPDVFGHSGNWANYLLGIEQSDIYLKNLCDFIETHPDYKDNTYLFVTNDHGRHCDGINDGFISHGDGCVCCKHINLFAFGPTIIKDSLINTPRNLVDIPATISSILNFEMPTGRGEVMVEIFE